MFNHGKWKKHCQFKDECEHYRISSYTCRNGGGNYCGQFRAFLNKKKSIKQQKVLEVLI